MLEHLRSQGGGVARFPPLDGDGYQLSDTIVIDFSNCEIELEENVRLTKRTKAACFFFSGARSAYLRNVGIRGIGGLRTVDGNARNMRGFAYALHDTLYGCVQFRHVRGWHASYLYGYNGLVNGIRAIECADGLVDHCEASHARFDNGVTIDHDPTDILWSSGNSTSWANTRVRDVRCWANQSFGAASYAASGTIFERVAAFDNGDDTNASLVSQGGGISAEHNALDPSHMSRNHAVQIIDCTAVRNRNNALWVTAAGTMVQGGSFSDTVAPRVRSNRTGLYGFNVAIVASGSATIKGARIERGASGGIYLLATAHGKPSLSFDGEITSSGGIGIQARGIAALTTSPQSQITGSGHGKGHHGVYVSNLGRAYNQGQGRVRLAGVISGSGDQAVQIEYVAEADLSGSRFRNNGGSVVAGAANTRAALADGVVNTDQNRKNLYIISLAPSVESATVRNVTGDSLVAPSLNLAHYKRP
ncbi:hypothetical protein [Sphingomonas sp.]|uniref:hypothetical protein n=1 Tax=Sphingomonas sp. TaxID=28214 RepID=UPI002EDBAAC5